MLQQTLDSTETEVGGGDVQGCAMTKVIAGGVEHCVERRATDFCFFFHLLVHDT